MARKPKSKPSFFKVLIKDFNHHLQLPPAFVDKYGQNLPEKAKLRISSSRYTSWNVKLEQIDDDENCCFFTRGWTKFVEDLGLQIGEFLIFRVNFGNKATTTFDVSVYGINGCERLISVDDSPVVSSDDDDDFESIEEVMKHKRSRDDDVVENEHPRFERVLKEHHRYRLCVLKEFAVAAGLMNEKAVVLKYGTRKGYWRALLDHNPNMRQFRIDLALGWGEFLRKNGLVMGKTYSFEYIRETNVIQVKLLNEEVN